VSDVEYIYNIILLIANSSFLTGKSYSYKITLYINITNFFSKTLRYFINTVSLTSLFKEQLRLKNLKVYTLTNLGNDE
jgi:hypothetical protein